jgi:histidinol dehydrogenase
MSETTMLIQLLNTRDAGFETAFGALETRREVRGEQIEAAVSQIVEDVRRRGDDAVLDAVARFDGYRLTRDQIRLSEQEITEGAARLPKEDREALHTASDRIRRFHSIHIPASWSEGDQDELLGQRVLPLARVGLYVPAGKAPLASTVLMLGLPAREAGVAELVITSPGRELHPAVLEAARLVGVNELLRIGGAQAVAALAYGTESVPRVDKIVGPGNAYVQAAKRQVFGQVAIDAEAGPSEVLICWPRQSMTRWPVWF